MVNHSLLEAYGHRGHKGLAFTVYQLSLYDPASAILSILAFSLGGFVIGIGLLSLGGLYLVGLLR